jgi:cobalt-zinc-cadmium efflux system protein
MSEGHGREHGHGHGAAPGSDGRWLAAAGALIVAFMCGEVAAGIVAHSLALLSDAAHMLTDAASIGMALVTMRVAARPPRGGYTLGLRRAEILSAQANGITLVLLAAWLGYAAIRRLIAPQPAAGGLMLTVALTGVAVNLAAATLLARASRKSLNVEGAFTHVLTDLYAFIATAAAAAIILATGFTRADPVATLVVVALMLHAGTGLVRQSGRIFLEAAPAGLDPAELGTAMAARPCVAEVHDLHVWEITSGMPAASAHVLVAAGQDCHGVRADLERLLASRGITHATLQVDHVTGHSADGPAAGHQRPHPVPRGPGAGPPDGTAASAQPHCDDPHGPRYRPQAPGERG